MNSLFTSCLMVFTHFLSPVSPEGSVRVTPSVVNVVLNTTISATCTAEGGPNNQFTWSALATTGDVTVLQNDPELRVDVSEVDDTVYSCRVENSAGSEEANLTIYSKPRTFYSVFICMYNCTVAPVISHAPTDMNATRTERFQIECCIRGFPIPTIQWYHNDSIFTLRGQSTLDFFYPFDETLSLCGRIYFSSVSTDSGVYVCQGTNVAGNISSAPFLVLVQGEWIDALCDILKYFLFNRSTRETSHN